MNTRPHTNLRIKAMAVGTVALAVVASASAMHGGCVTQMCYTDADCSSPKICGEAGKCVYECSQDEDCGAAMTCVNRKCKPAYTHDIVCPGDMVNIAGAFCIDRFEASRVDATSSSPGEKEGHAVSRSGVLPWRLSGPDSNQVARNACLAAGKELCTPQQWQAACQGKAQTVYGYGDHYQPEICNGIETFGVDKLHLVPTGSMPQCKSDWGVFDMNGNLWEHVLGGSNMTVRGGAFNCIDSKSNHRCDYVPGNWEPSAQGFRCCLTPEPIVDGGNGETDAGEDVQSDTEAGCLDLDADAADVSDVTSDSEEPKDTSSRDVHHEVGPNGCFEGMARIKTSNRDFCIDIYEASRQDATDVDDGVSDVPVSVAGVVPWHPIDLLDARAACDRAGKRLCRAEEWEHGCSGKNGTVYGYGNTYDPVICNGIDTYCNCDSPACQGVAQCPYPHCFSSPSADGKGPCGASLRLMVTGAMPDCKSTYGLFDINGNVWEVVDSDDGQTHVRGGAYNCIDSEALHRCDYDSTMSPPVRGFRCCGDPQ